jgi:dipeptidase E
MKYYLSSARIESKNVEFESACKGHTRIGVISNALDYISTDMEEITADIDSQVNDLTNYGLQAEVVDLRDYFGKPAALTKKIKELGAVWVCGGGVYVLRQAMKLSGFDEILLTLSSDKNFLYSAYSAGCCILSANLEIYQYGDESRATPYEGLNTMIWEGLGLIDYVFLPHFEADNQGVNRTVEYCEENGVVFKALRDGEALVFQQ